MHYSLTDEETMIRDTARKIASDRLIPHAEALDRGEGIQVEFGADGNLHPVITVPA